MDENFTNEQPDKKDTQEPTQNNTQPKQKNNVGKICILLLAVATGVAIINTSKKTGGDVLQEKTLITTITLESNSPTSPVTNNNTVSSLENQTPAMVDSPQDAGQTGSDVTTPTDTKKPAKKAKKEKSPDEMTFKVVDIKPSEINPKKVYILVQSQTALEVSKPQHIEKIKKAGSKPFTVTTRAITPTNLVKFEAERQALQIINGVQTFLEVVKVTSPN